MHGARITLLVCLLVGLVAVAYAARGHLRELRSSVEQSEERALRAELKGRGREFAAAIAQRMRAAPVTATYDADGALLRPAPPGEARRFEPGALVIRDLKSADSILEHAGSGPARVQALLRLGTERRDPAPLRQALAEEAVRGTDLALRIRLEIRRIGKEAPDAAWIDDVSALLGGPSDRLARVLLAEAGVDAVERRTERRALAALRPRPGYTVQRDDLVYVGRDADLLRMHRLPLASLHEGVGALAEPLPEPFGRVLVRGDIDRAAVDARLSGEQWKIAGLYALAGLILLVGTIYAYVAVGRAFRLARERSDFIANVTHELKTPLANIRLYGESLREGRVREPDRAEFVATILEEARRLDTLVEGLLHAARGPRLELSSLDPRALLEEAAGRWRPRLLAEGFRLTVDAPALPHVRGDREALLRAVDNLVDNARKYGRNDPRIELFGAARNGDVRLTVRDHGPGIPAPDRARVMRPFARLESADRKETPGTGLGLSLAVSMAEAHGGRVEIGSVEGGGAAVTLVLPAEGT